LPREYFNAREARRILEKNLKYYLAYRTINAYDVRPELPAKVAQMAEYLYLGLGIKNTSQRWEVLLKLCEGLVATVGSGAR